MLFIKTAWAWIVGNVKLILIVAGIALISYGGYLAYDAIGSSKLEKINFEASKKKLKEDQDALDLKIKQFNLDSAINERVAQLENKYQQTGKNNSAEFNALRATILRQSATAEKTNGAKATGGNAEVFATNFRECKTEYANLGKEYVNLGEEAARASDSAHTLNSAYDLLDKSIEALTKEIETELNKELGDTSK